MNERERQEKVMARLEMLARVDPEGAELIQEELRAWHQRSMNQADTIKKLQRTVRTDIVAEGSIRLKDVNDVFAEAIQAGVGTAEEIKRAIETAVGAHGMRELARADIPLVTSDHDPINGEIVIREADNTKYIWIEDGYGNGACVELELFTQQLGRVRTMAEAGLSEEQLQMEGITNG